MGHAELVALRQAAWITGDWRMNQCTLIVTLEPCPMCAGALVQARVGRVIYGAFDRKRGGLGGTVDLANHPKRPPSHGCTGRRDGNRSIGPTGPMVQAATATP